jgi:hypothetical protein
MVETSHGGVAMGMVVVVSAIVGDIHAHHRWIIVLTCRHLCLTVHHRGVNDAVSRPMFVVTSTWSVQWMKRVGST